MRWFAFLLVAALCLAENMPSTFIGVIHSNQCVGPACATQCPISKTPKYTLQSGSNAWLLSDQQMPARYVGRKVIVTGTPGSDNSLRVISITPAPGTARNN